MHSSIIVNSSPHIQHLNFKHPVRSDSLSPTIFLHMLYAFHSYFPRFAVGCLAMRAGLALLLAIADWSGIALQPMF